MMRPLSYRSSGDVFFYRTALKRPVFLAIFGKNGKILAIGLTARIQRKRPSTASRRQRGGSGWLTNDLENPYDLERFDQLESLGLVRDGSTGSRTGTGASTRCATRRPSSGAPWCVRSQPGTDWSATSGSGRRSTRSSATRKGSRPPSVSAAILPCWPWARSSAEQ